MSDMNYLLRPDKQNLKSCSRLNRDTTTPWDAAKFVNKSRELDPYYDKQFSYNQLPRQLQHIRSQQSWNSLIIYDSSDCSWPIPPIALMQSDFRDFTYKTHMHSLFIFRYTRKSNPCFVLRATGPQHCPTVVSATTITKITRQILSWYIRKFCTEAGKYNFKRSSQPSRWYSWYNWSLS